MPVTSFSPDTKAPIRTVAEVLGLGSVADANDTVSTDAVQALYRYARNEFGNRELITNNSTFSRGWVDLDAGTVRTYLDPFYAADGDSKQAKRNAQANLLAIAWNDLLGIDEPAIRIQVKIHGVKWGLRFAAAEAAMKGKERINEDLPAIPAMAAQSPPVPQPAPTSGDASSGQPAPAPVAATIGPSAPVPSVDISSILNAGGMPS
jgi:hypothetical protein